MVRSRALPKKYRQWQCGDTATYDPNLNPFQFSNQIEGIKKWLNDQKRGAIKKETQLCHGRKKI
jgi:hypothetical protein